MVSALFRSMVCLQGDNDPVDVVEIGSKALDMGGVYPVKPLAVLAMIDDGELDWKVVAIRADDPKASSVNDVEDVERCVVHFTYLCSFINTSLSRLQTAAV